MNDIHFPLQSDPAFIAAGQQSAAAPRKSRDAMPLITHYWRIALRRRWLIIASVAVALLSGFMLTILTTPKYTAKTRIEISREGKRIVNVQDVTPEASAVDSEFYQTQYGLLRSRTLAERVVTELGLQDDRAFFASFGREEDFDKNRRFRPARIRLASDILLKQVTIIPLRLSRLVDIEWTGPDPALAARVSNAWATGFIEYNLERRFDATSYARRFLESRLEQLRKRLEDSERQLVRYASDQAIINVPTGATDENGELQERSLTAESLAALNTELAKAMADRIAAESRLRTGQGRATVETVQNQAIGNLRQRRAEAVSEYAELLEKFDPQYPEAVAMAARIRQLDRSIAAEESRASSLLSSGYNNALLREREVRAKLEALKDDFLDQRRRSIQYNIYKREVDTNRVLYNGLLQRYKEIGVAGGIGENNISIVDNARVPERPSSPRPILNMILALLSGAIVGFGLALIREQIDESIGDPADLEEKLAVPLLGAVPQVAGRDPVEEVRDPKSPLMEAYISVQTSLMFATPEGFPRSLAVTSTRPAEGKSTTSYALAYLLARNGYRVVLVDGDLRSPSVHGFLGLANTVGLSTYLAGGDSVEPLVQRTSNDLAVITAGPQPPNAAELLRGDRLEAFISDLLKSFDRVVIDAPPVMALADAPLIASRAEATIYVVEASGVKARMARMAIERLRQSRARILGAVLTKFEARNAQYGYDYEYGYGYGSGGDRSEA